MGGSASHARPGGGACKARRSLADVFGGGGGGGERHPGAAAKERPEAVLEEVDGEDEEDVPLARPGDLSDDQKRLLKDSWVVVEKNVAEVGVITFISLFETHPDVQQVFMPFNGIELEDLKYSKQLRAHALRVMAFVQKAVARLHEPEKLENLLNDLGTKHYAYGAKEKYIDLIGPQFIQAIQPSLESQWSAELHEAWTDLFRFMAYVMKTNIGKERRRVAAHQ